MARESGEQYGWRRRKQMDLTCSGVSNDDEFEEKIPIIAHVGRSCAALGVFPRIAKLAFQPHHHCSAMPGEACRAPDPRSFRSKVQKVEEDCLLGTVGGAPRDGLGSRAGGPWRGVLGRSPGFWTGPCTYRQWLGNVSSGRPSLGRWGAGASRAECRAGRRERLRASEWPWRRKGQA